jgi:phosphoribosylformylglycinamidine synthase
VQRIGETKKSGVGIDQIFALPLADLRRAHEGFFPTLMGADAALA